LKIRNVLLVRQTHADVANQASGAARTVAGSAGKSCPDSHQLGHSSEPESTALLEQEWDHIFFTGGTMVAKVVMTAAVFSAGIFGQ
jgi:hypothetical protein